jgi:hypothetical protein
MMRAASWLLVLALGAVAPATAQAGGADAQGRAAAQSEPRWELFPEDLLYEPYLADSSRPTFALAFMSVQQVDVASSGDARHLVSLGARAGIVRWRPAWSPATALQLDLHAGFHGQFDRDFDTDNIGWDGIYGLSGALTRHDRLAFKVGIAHVSSHVGDEYAERTGRERINYTREELVLGASWRFAPSWRVYAEIGDAYDLRNPELQAEGRWQSGLEYERPEGLWGTRFGWYAAADVEGMEERDWETDVSVQVGLLLPSSSRSWRVGIAWYEGRVPIGEFFQDDEEYLSFGLWLDI